MKHKQGSFIRGYVTVQIKGNRPELFFQKCMQAGILVWDIKKTGDDLCVGNVKLSDIKKIRSIKRKMDYKIQFISKKGYPFFIKRFTRKKQLMVGLIMSFMLIIFLSNIIWEVRITGVPSDIEEKISKQLNNYGIHSGAWIFTLESPNSIQQQLVQDVPELLWVGVHQKGTTFYLEGVEKSIVKEEESRGPRHLIANKKGIIKNMYVSEGLPRVAVNDYVEPGDVLVSGILNEDEIEAEKEEDENSEETETNLELVTADGEITATTWYEVTVNVPLEGNYEHVTGNQKDKYYLQLGRLQLPIWGFGKPDYDEIHRESNEKSINFFKWELPIKFVTNTLSEKVNNNVERTKEEAINTGIQQAKNELKLQLGQDSKIISENVLHETTESGKVKLNLYISVEEDIVRNEPIQPINQGD
ncbi:hypothetical protein J2Z83_000798 [Virgibacillus natechei]|uniref:Sporulation protein YqfD n=1 Tax=Virgibacillus natechei TaxID=1216297 RepID=A0ABS4ICP0_9BACI|nr:sporulation protein YqfD [Virgibacillus natechei]MBP1968704.1 hypothetical protein [Virgibacillus natechei]UZD11506.1 sporulation protein YqfD [Virgibacillus natechei]